MRNALKKVGLEKEKDLSKKYPHQLSGGMKQRIILAMHIIISPNILIADEPTSALDGIHKLKFVKLLKDISENEHMAVIFISHNIALVSYFCDNVLVIDKGKIIAHDTRNNIINNNKNIVVRKMVDNAKKITGDYNGDY